MSPDVVFTATPPAEVTRKLVTTIQIGWLYDREDDENGKAQIVYRTDDEGSYVPRIVAVPACLTTAETARVSAAMSTWAQGAGFGEDALDRLDGDSGDATDPVDAELGTRLMFHLVGAALGKGVLDDVAGDPAVGYALMVQFVTRVCTLLHLFDLDDEPAAEVDSADEAPAGSSGN